jgi:hypothetical protein
MTDFKKDDKGKPPLALLPWNTLNDVAFVFENGAKKYGEKNYLQAQKEDATRYISAALRHISAHCSGEITDSESSLPHLAHAAADVLIALELAEKD